MCSGAIMCRLHARLLEEGRGHQAAPPGLLELKPQTKALSKEDHLLTGKGLNCHLAQAFLLFFFFFFSSGGYYHGIVHILGGPQVGLADLPGE